MKKILRRLLIVLGIVIVVLGLAFGVLVLVIRNSLPEARPGPQADLLARSIEQSVGVEGWRRTGVVRWVFRGSHRHLWDRKRQLARVRWDDAEVMVDLGRRTGVAWRSGKKVTGPAGQRLVDEAYSYWANDSFWLSAIFKLFDPGVTRGLARLKDGRTGLLVTYTTGGVTPGDSYLWIPGAGGRPYSWRMWVSIVPVGGLEMDIEEWTRLSTGALIPTRHSLLGMALRLTQVEGAARLGDLIAGTDPFAALVTK